MPNRRPPRHLRVFIASPGDVLPERQAVRDLLQRLERSPLLREDFTIEAVSWDDPDGPVPMLATLTPQQAVSRALPTPADCDITLVIVAARMGTPLDERKPDGSAYVSGTEWEFENARRASRPVLLYRRTTPPEVTIGDADEAARQRRSVDQFFAQFTAPGGVLKAGYTTYATVEDLTSRLRTDIESLLPGLRPRGDTLPENAPWIERAKARVRRWHYARLLMILALGGAITLVAWTAFAAFSTTLIEHDAPPLAYLIRYLLLALVLLVPAGLIVLTWWWLAPAESD